jgi:hypothetical protein
MPQVNARIAAEMIGKDRSTVLRAIDSGKLSASKDERGRYLIDPAELERVYGSLRMPATVRDADAEAMPHSDYATAAAAAASAREAEVLRETLEHERRLWADERTYLRSLIDRQSEQMKLLADQREASPRPGFWQRLLRRA